MKPSLISFLCTLLIAGGLILWISAHRHTEYQKSQLQYRVWTRLHPGFPLTFEEFQAAKDSNLLPR